MGFLAAAGDPADWASPLRTELPAGSASPCVTLRDPQAPDGFRRAAWRKRVGRLVSRPSRPGTGWDRMPVFKTCVQVRRRVFGARALTWTALLWALGDARPGTSGKGPDNWDTR